MNNYKDVSNYSIDENITKTLNCEVIDQFILNYWENMPFDLSSVETALNIKDLLMDKFNVDIDINYILNKLESYEN